jgi:hypothetical protein
VAEGHTAAIGVHSAWLSKQAASKAVIIIASQGPHKLREQFFVFFLFCFFCLKFDIDLGASL